MGDERRSARVEISGTSAGDVEHTAVSRHRLSVSPTQLRVLSLLKDRPEINVNGLAELLDVVPSSASRLCDRLEAIGLVRRMAEPSDRREVRLTPTAAAESLLGEVRSRRHEAVQAVLDRMPARVQQDLLRALQAFAQASASAGTDASARSA
ncbi:MarR family winged helix-turn-helix transcriptional regulator [Micromonospora sp. LOL_024]|uniref:MarR family winged helix-turn-helix transcriptional regulator n=1 Tax=Micromonospora sp. LOL_024 TaxID=3345412 RepID=UPI003A857E40